MNKAPPFIWHESKLNFSSDTAVEFLLWSNIEEALGIVCANIPLVVSYIESRKRSGNTTVKSKLHTGNSFLRSGGGVMTASAYGPQKTYDNLGDSDDSGYLMQTSTKNSRRRAGNDPEDMNNAIYVSTEMRWGSDPPGKDAPHAM
jgi:hypothetical protein